MTLGWDVYSFDHEGGDGQYEFDFDYSDGARRWPTSMILFRLMVKHVARSLAELPCSCLSPPRPHSVPELTSTSAWLTSLPERTYSNEAPQKGHNERIPVEEGYDEVAYQFTAGVLEHAGAITAVLAPTVNSYKRLLPRGLMNEISWAPVFRAYGYNNRTLMLRLPVNRRCLEIRVADSAANLYLGTALVLAAGLDGIRREPEARGSRELRHLQDQ